MKTNDERLDQLFELLRKLEYIDVKDIPNIDL